MRSILLRMHGHLTFLSLLLLFNIGNILGQDAKATFNMRNFIGSIRFASNGAGSTAYVTISQSSKTYECEIRSFPVILTQNDPCSETNLGPLLYNLTNVISIDSNPVNNKTVQLVDIRLHEGDNPITGRSVLLRSGDDRVCATILSDGMQVSFAIVNGHVAGNVHVFKIGTRYAVFTDLFSTQSKLSSSEASLQVFKENILIDQPDSKEKPPSVMERCSQLNSQNAVVEVKNVPIAGAGSTTKYLALVTISDASFDFSSGYLIIQRTSVLTCASFHRFEPKKVKAVFSSNGVAGYMEFSQPHPYAATTSSIAIQGLNSLANGYHVHEYPIAYRYTATTNLCSNDVTAGHFSPLPVAPGITQDFAEIGDLSRKYGGFRNQTEMNFTAEDWYLPLFGKHSIIGRSIVIHKDTPTMDRWVCANIGYPGPTITAVAQFNKFARGKVTLVQEEGKPWSDTTVFVQMSVVGFDSLESNNHSYHVHDGRASYLPNDTCITTGPHWNPYGAAIGDSNVYPFACSPNSKLGCEVGDLSMKFGRMKLGAGSKQNKYMYTDGLPLSGAYSILNKSIVIHGPEGGPERVDCANIYKKLSVKAKVSGWTLPGKTSSSFTGDIQFKQSEITGVTSLLVKLLGLNKEATIYHVHQTSLPHEYGSTNNICDSTGGHFNPYNVTEWKQGDTLDKFEVGDLSGKFGAVSDMDSHNLMKEDTNIPLDGINSIIGRSVVIHSKNGRWGCANILFDPEKMNGELITGVATFDGDIKGSIQLSQIIDATGGRSDVSIDIMLQYKNTSSSIGHNWHVHEAVIEGKDCDSVGGHYNPFKADLSNPMYKAWCSGSNATMCEVGDLAGKLGRIDIKVGSHYVFNDDFLSLEGGYSVLGKSIVLHGANGAGQKIACADIEPQTSGIEFYIKKPSGLFRAIMAKKIADQLGVSPQMVYVKVSQEFPACIKVEVRFTGLAADVAMMKTKFNKLSIQEYSAIQECSSGSILMPTFIWLFLGIILLTTVF